MSWWAGMKRRTYTFCARLKLLLPISTSPKNHRLWKKVSVNIDMVALARAWKINFLDFFTTAADTSLFYHLCRWLLCADPLCYCGTQFGSGSAESESFERIEFSGASPAASFPPRTGWYSKWSGVEVDPDSLKRFDRRSVKLNKLLINTRKLSESVCDTWAAQ